MKDEIIMGLQRELTKQKTKYEKMNRTMTYGHQAQSPRSSRITIELPEGQTLTPENIAQLSQNLNQTAPGNLARQGTDLERIVETPLETPMGHVYAYASGNQGQSD